MTYFFETDEHAALRRQIGRFASSVIEPNAHAWDEAGEFPRDRGKVSARRGARRRDGIKVAVVALGPAEGDVNVQGPCTRRSTFIRILLAVGLDRHKINPRLNAILQHICSMRLSLSRRSSR